jgi:hypothetical protein
MARSKPAPAGHNSGGLTDDDIAALTAFHGQKLRTLRMKVEEAALAVKSARTAVNGQFKLIAKDLQYTRIEFEDLLAKQDMDEKAFLDAEARRARRYSLGGLPVGAQLDMFATPPDTVDDAQLSYLDGKRAGVRGGDRDVPGKIATMFHSDWLRGWDDGQHELILKLGRAEAIIAEREAAPKAGELSADEEDDDTDLDPDTIAKKARALKKGGFMEPTPEEQSFSDEAAGGTLEVAA